MGNLFNLNALTPTLLNARDKALAMAGELIANGVVGGHVLPPLPPFPESGNDAAHMPTPLPINGRDGLVAFNTTGYENLDAAALPLTTPTVGLFGVPMCFPLTIWPQSWPESKKWLLPIEPIITIGGGNTLVKRNVAKMPNGNFQRRGGIKERWATDDYTISITGMLTSVAWVYPQADVMKLAQICEAREPINVECDLLQIFGISRIVIEKYDFPFTKGDENQAYTISALSDDDWDLFIPLTNNNQ